MNDLIDFIERVAVLRSNKKAPPARGALEAAIKLVAIDTHDALQSHRVPFHR